MSGRTLKKLPLVCISEHFHLLPINLNHFLIALAKSVMKIIKKK